MTEEIVPYNKGNAISRSFHLHIPIAFGVKNVIRFTKVSFILQFHRTRILPNKSLIAFCRRIKGKSLKR